MSSWSMLIIKILRGASSGPSQFIMEGAGWKVVREKELWKGTGVETYCGTKTFAYSEEKNRSQKRERISENINEKNMKKEFHDIIQY